MPDEPDEPTPLSGLVVAPARLLPIDDLPAVPAEPLALPPVWAQAPADDNKAMAAAVANSFLISTSLFCLQIAGIRTFSALCQQQGNEAQQKRCRTAFLY
jgi:hypothetical protein